MVSIRHPKFKETEIGPIPEEWNIILLKEIVNIQTGFPFPGDQYGRGGVKVARGENIKEGVFDWSKLKTWDSLSGLEKYTLASDDIVVAMDGNVGRNRAIVDGGDLPIVLAQRVARLRSKSNDLDQGFLQQIILSNLFKEYCKSVKTGTTIDHISQRQLENLLIPLPSVEEQKQIAEILSSLGDDIEFNRKINANLEKLASALFKKWFVDIGDKLPEGWRMGTFGESIINFDSRRIPLSSREREKRHGKYPYYGATSIMDYVDDFIFDGTYVLLGEDGSVAKEDGKPFIQYVQGKIWVNNHAHVLQGKNGFSTEYIKIFLEQVDILPFVTGAVQPKLNQANMNSIPMIIPDPKTLGRFNEILTGLFGEILGNESQNKNLGQVRDSLLPRLMNGKIRAI